MPRTIFCQKKQPEVNTADLLLGYAYANSGYKLPDLIIRTGIKRATMYNRMADPEKLTLGELRQLAKAGDYTDEQLIAIIRRGK